jgi:uncharacterized protein with von Willebrand factor type A (vWA) domain
VPGADVARRDGRRSPRAPRTRALWGRTNYGRAFTEFAGVTPTPRPEVVAARPGRRPLQLQRPRARRCARLADRRGTRCWLNPEHRRHWDTGDSRRRQYGEIVPMVECRNLAQLGEFVHDLV